MVELTEIGDGVLTRPDIGADALDQGVVGVGLAILGASVAAQEHGGLLVIQNDEAAASNQGTSVQLGLHYIDLTRFSLRKTGRFGDYVPHLG